MTDIPDDIHEKAAAALSQFPDSRVKTNLGVIIARALHAERLATEARVREECAKMALTAAERDVISERRRQVEVEGWTAERDDIEHATGQLARAAGCYAAVAGQGKGSEYHVDGARRGRRFGDWPWHSDWWKPTTPRRDLVKAAALCLAEIERIDRAAAIREGRK